MRKITIALATLVANFALVGQTAPPTKIGVIQIQAALVATREGQKAASELETKMAPKKKDLESKQAEIKDMQERLQKGGNLLSDSAKDELTRNIDAKTKSFNRDIEDAQADLEQEQQKLLSELGQKMMQVLDKYASDNGFAMILDVSNQNTPVVFAASAIDVTKDVIEMYDKTVAAAPAAPAKPAAAPAPAAAPKPAAAKPPAAAPTKP